MTETFGADPHLEVTIDADADAAAAEVQATIAAALANAMRDPRIQAGIRHLVDATTKGAQDIPKGFNQAFRKVEADGKRSARSLKGVWDEVGKSASKVLRTPPPNVTSSYATLAAHVKAMGTNMDKLLEASREQLRVIEELGRSTRNVVNAEAQAARDATSRTLQDKRSQSARLQLYAQIIKQVGQITTAAIRGFTRVVTSAQRALLRVVELTWKSAERAVRAFARGASEAIRGFGRVVSRAFSAMGHAVSSFVRGAASTLRGLGRGLGSVLSGMSRAFSSAFRRDESAFNTSLRRRERDLSASISRQQRSVQRAQTVRQGGLLGGLGTGGLLAGGGVAAFLSAGFTRAGQEEALQISFETLLQNGPKAEAVLQRISEFARTTSFDFVEVAKATQQLYAAFGDIGEAERLTRFLADVTALAGGTTEEFSRARVGFGRIAQSGRLGAEELNIIEDAIPGIPIGQILADAFFGGDIAKFSAARLSGELGEISADEFFEAYESGVRERFPGVEGSAQRMAGTLTGLAQNFKENLSIFGAEIIRLFEGPIKSALDTGNRLLGFLGGFVSGEIFPKEITGAGVGFRAEEGLGFTQDQMEGLREFRDILANVAKSLGFVFGGLAGLKLLRLAFIGLTSPLGLLVTAVTGVVGGLTFLTQRSTRLSSGLTFLGHRFRFLGYFVKSTLEAFGNLGSAIIGLFRKTGVDGAKSLFTRMGDQLARVVGVLNRGLKALRDWANWAAEMVRAGRISEVFDDISDKAQVLLGRLLGLNEDEISWSRFLNGNDFSNIFTTFLDKIEEIPIIGPITSFARRVIDGLSNAIGNIWDVIFGSDETGGPGARFRAEEAVDESMATRILNALDDTFLGPILRWFRGPFSDAIETAIAQAVDIFRGFVDGIEAVWRVLEPILDPLTDAFRDFFRTFREEGAGTAFGSIGRGLLDTLYNIGAALVEFGSNIPGWIEDAADTAIPFITDKLDPIWDAITGWFLDTFTIENLTAAGDFILDFAYEIGRALGNALGDIRIYAVILAALAALGILIGNTLLGVFQGVISNAPEWGSIIAGGINDAIGGILPDQIFENKILSGLIGAAIIAAVAAGLTIAGKGIFAAGSTVSAAGVSSFSWGKVPFGIASSLVGAIGREFIALWKGGQYLFTRDRTKITGENAVFSGIGQKIGGAILGGVAIAFGGQAIGRALPGPGGILLGALFGIGTGAAIGSAIAPGLGTAIGAVIGGALGAISAAFGANAAAAEKAAHEVDEYVDALERVREGARDAAADTVIQNLKDALSGAGEEFLIGAHFDAQAFVDSVLAGTFDVETAFSDMLTGAIGRADLSEAQFNFLQDFQTELDSAIGEGFAGTEAFDQALLALQGITDLSQSELIAQLNDALGPLGLDADTLRAVLGSLKTEARELALGVNELGRTDALATTAERVDTVSEAVSAINDELEGHTTAQAIADILSQADLTSEERLEALGDVADDLKDRFSDAREALEDLLNPPEKEGTIGGITNQIVADLPSIAAGFQSIFADFEAGEISANVSFAQVDIEVEGFRDRISDAVLEGFDSGAIRTDADFDTFIGGLRTQIENAGLDQATEDQLLAVVSQFEGMDLGEFFDLVGLIEQDQATIDEAAQLMATQLGQAAAGAAGVVAGRPMVQVRAIGNKVAGEVAEGIKANAGTIQAALDKAVGGVAGGKKVSGESFGVDVDDSSVADAQNVVRRTLAIFIAGTALMLRAGDNMGEAMARGFRTGISGLAALAGAAAVSAALAAQRLAGFMFQVGVNLGDSLARGVRSQISAAAIAATLLATAAIRAARSTLQSASPSKVFVSIGRDIGRGFIQGIKDSEGDMVSALSDALENVVTKAAAKAGAAVRRAQVGQAIFDLLVPSRLPGGASNTELQTGLAQLRESILGLTQELRDSAASAFGSGQGAAFFGARVQAEGIRLSLADALRDVALKFNEALNQQKAIAKFDKDKAALEEKLRLHQITKKEFDDAIEKLGARPVSLTPEQLNLLRSGPQTLDPRTIAGQANISALQQALETVRAYGQAALEAGVPITDVIDKMRQYIAGILAEAKARGLSIDTVRGIIDQLGLSTADLNEIQRQLLSLDISELAGAANVQKINEQLQAIRDYASDLLAAGGSAANVTGIITGLVAEVVKAATTFGFSATQIGTLVTQAGLSGAALKEFIRQLAAFDAAAAGAAGAAAAAAKAAADKAKAEAAQEAADKAAAEAADKAAAKPIDYSGGIPRPLIGTVEVNLPYGDPEAVALAVANRVAYDAVTSW